MDYLPTLLDGVTLPGNDLDLDLFKSVLMERCGLLTPLYSEPETMKEVISIWFRTHSWNIERLIALIKTKYAPLENYDRHEDLSRDKNDTRNRTENRTENTTGTSTENTTGTSSETRTQHYEEEGTITTDEVTERTVAAFNTSAYSPADKTDHDATTTTETSGDTTGTTSGQTGGTVAVQSTGQTAGQTAGQEAGAEAEHAVNWIHGNIGVMTTQSMFLEESSLLQGFNIYTFIAEMFAKDLTLSIW